MAPWRSHGVLQAGVAVIDRDPPVQSFIDGNFGSGKAEASAVLGDLEALALPLDNVVVADHALVNEAADAIEIFWSGERRRWCEPPDGGAGSPAVGVRQSLLPLLPQTFLKTVDLTDAERE
jgi:hypothetical protein